MWNRAKDKVNKKLTVHVIRHGKTRLNEEHRYQGTIDEGLSEVGKISLHNLKAQTEYPMTDIVFVSPMRRAVETAQILYGEEQPFIIVNEFKEMFFGDFDGKNYDELKDIKEYREWIHACTKALADRVSCDKQKGSLNDSIKETSLTAYNGVSQYEQGCVNSPESVDDFIDRTKKGLEKVYRKCQEIGVSEAVIVAHGGTIMAISELLGERYYSHNVNCGGYITFEI